MELIIDCFYLWLAGFVTCLLAFYIAWASFASSIMNMRMQTPSKFPNFLFMGLFSLASFVFGILFLISTILNIMIYYKDVLH